MFLISTNISAFKVTVLFPAAAASGPEIEDSKLFTI